MATDSGQPPKPKGDNMFKRSNNARIIKENNYTNNSKENPEKKVLSFSTGDKPSAVSAHSINNGKTIIGEGVIIEGKICGAGNVIIEGSMKGNVELAESSITVGPQGRLEGEITAKDAVISGQVMGKINAAGTVNIARHADFCGDIKAKNISIDDGAFFKGKIEMVRKPNRNIEATGGPTAKLDEKKC